MAHPAALPLLLRGGDHEELSRLVRASSVRAGLAQWAWIVLLASEGLRNAEIADRVGASRPMVNVWRSRYVDAGMAGAAFAQPDQQPPDQGGVLRRSLYRGEGCLVPSMPMPSATTQRWSAKCTPSMLIATRSSPDRSAASRSASACSVIATNLRDTADLLIDPASSSTPWPTGSNATG
jgi:hypothetical protein